MYAATYDSMRIANFVGMNLTGADTRNVFIRSNDFQADGYRSPPASAATTRAVMSVAAGTSDWRVTNDMMLSVTTPFADLGTAHLYRNATSAPRIVLSSGGYVDHISGGTATQLQLHDCETGSNIKGLSATFDDGSMYLGLLNDNGSVKREAMSVNPERVRLGRKSGSTAALAVHYAGNTVLIVGGVEKLISIGAPDSAGARFRTLRIPN